MRLHGLMTILGTFIFANGFSSTEAFVNTGYRNRESFSVNLRATAADAIAALDESQRTTLNKIAAVIPDLQSKPELSWAPQDGVTVAGCTAHLDGREAPGANGNVGWLSSVCIHSKMSSLTVFNGPLTNVPHLLSRCCVVNDNMLSFALDFRPRAYGAYEMKDAQGNFPGPEDLGREAFTYSGNRMEYDNNFGTPEVINFLDSFMSYVEGSGGSFQPPSDLDLLISGPLKIDITLPISDRNIDAIAAAREKAVDVWLAWVLDDKYDLRPGAPINAQYVYDTKYKLNAYGALLPVYTQLFGAEDGAKLTAAESGPLDEAYVGGAS